MGYLSRSGYTDGIRGARLTGATKLSVTVSAKLPSGMERITVFVGLESARSAEKVCLLAEGEVENAVWSTMTIDIDGLARDKDDEWMLTIYTDPSNASAAGGIELYLLSVETVDTKGWFRRGGWVLTLLAVILVLLTAFVVWFFSTYTLSRVMIGRAADGRARYAWQIRRKTAQSTSPSHKRGAPPRGAPMSGNAATVAQARPRQQKPPQDKHDASLPPKRPMQKPAPKPTPQQNTSASAVRDGDKEAEIRRRTKGMAVGLDEFESFVKKPVNSTAKPAPSEAPAKAVEDKPLPAECEAEKPVESAEALQETISPSVNATDASNATNALPSVTESEVKGEDAE